MYPEKKPYTVVRLIENKDPLNEKFEVRVSIYVAYDSNAGRRAMSGHPARGEALRQAQEIARSELVRTSGSKL